MATLGKRGDRLNLVIRRGATFGPYQITMKDSAHNPIDISSVTLSAQIRKEYGAATAYPFDCEIVDGPAGKFSFTMAATDTDNIPYLGDPDDPENQYMWDFEMAWPDGTVNVLLYGVVRIYGEITV